MTAHFLHVSRPPDLEADLDVAARQWINHTQGERVIHCEQPDRLRLRPSGRTAGGHTLTREAWISMARRLSRHLPGILRQLLNSPPDGPALAVGTFNAFLRLLPERLQGCELLVQEGTVLAVYRRRRRTVIPHERFLTALQLACADTAQLFSHHVYLEGRTMRVVLIGTQTWMSYERQYRPGVLVTNSDDPCVPSTAAPLLLVTGMDNQRQGLFLTDAKRTVRWETLQDVQLMQQLKQALQCCQTHPCVKVPWFRYVRLAEEVAWISSRDPAVQAQQLQCWRDFLARLHAPKVLAEESIGRAINTVQGRRGMTWLDLCTAVSEASIKVLGRPAAIRQARLATELLQSSQLARDACAAGEVVHE